MPSDVLGTSVFNLKTTEFVFHPGPIFSNIVLVDEINRAPAKTQAALIEVMEERQVTIDGKTYPMQEPFIVMATQNPIEHEGTYRLPEAQLDRFAFKISAGYPTAEAEVAILERFNRNTLAAELAGIKPVITRDEWLVLQDLVRQVHVETKLLEYIARVIRETRQHNAFYLGASPRAGLAVLGGAKAWAAMNGRDFATPDDIRAIAVPALQHRLLLVAEKEMEGVSVPTILNQMLDSIEVPR
jgi:MoxR-like ATPase